MIEPAVHHRTKSILDNFDYHTIVVLSRLIPQSEGQFMILIISLHQDALWGEAQHDVLGFLADSHVAAHQEVSGFQQGDPLE